MNTRRYKGPNNTRSFYRKETNWRRQPQKPPESKVSVGRIFLFLFLAIVLGGVVIFVWQVYLSDHQISPEEEVAQLKEDISPAGFDFIVDKESRRILHLNKPFVVNLSGLENRRIVQLIIWWEVDNLDIAKELNDDLAKFGFIRDDIVKTIKSWTYAELSLGNGIERLKTQIRDRCNMFLKSGKITRVIFKDIRFKEILKIAN